MTLYYFHTIKYSVLMVCSQMKLKKNQITAFPLELLLLSVVLGFKQASSNVKLAEANLTVQTDSLNACT